MKPIKLIARDTGPLLSFDSMKEARKLKAELKRLTTNDSAYYAVLARFELGHFDQIATVALEKGKEPADYATEVKKALRMEINAAEWASAESAPAPTAKKRKDKLPGMKFTGEDAFEELRDHLRILGAPDFYQKTLESFGYKSASEIPSHDHGVKVARALSIERNRIQLERETIAIASKSVGPERAKELMQTLKDAHDTLGGGAFWGCLDKWGCPTTDYAVRSENLEQILAELKEICDYRNRT